MPRVTIANQAGPGILDMQLMLFDPMPSGLREFRTARISTVQGDVRIEIYSWTRHHVTRYGARRPSAFRGRIVNGNTQYPWLNKDREVYGEYDIHKREGWIANWLIPGISYAQQQDAPELRDQVVTLTLLPGGDRGCCQPGLVGMVIDRHDHGGSPLWTVEHDLDGTRAMYVTEELMPLSRKYLP